MKKRVLSIMLCMGMTMTLFAGCGSADQKQADHTEAVQETSTLSKLMDKDSTEEATEAAEVTETTESTEASETADPTASADTSSETVLETSASENDAAASSSTAKADTKNKTAAKSGSKSDSTSGSASQASQPAAASGSGSAKADNTTQAAAPAQTQQASSAQPAQPAAHEHHWEQYVKDTINHPEVGHYETKVVQAAYDEPQYDWHYICNKCGKDLGTDETTDLIDHEDVCDGSYRSDLVQVGTVHHDAVTEQVWVVDQAAWTENVYGYRCSCGATK
jgi:hypothetical protein